MNYIMASLSLGVIALAYIVYQRSSRISLADIPGTEPDSFLLGNLVHVFHHQVREADFAWLDWFGGTRIEGPSGEDVL
ncbi:hypothetical protein OBBRIDRAFT_794292 [Obba rivulosa]|uniref:Cytochrome P450 n=1 Tax=Obba rivulosa TaxID=1052685 RepID=A0A8E2DNB7_9APHY|nr:hypothetical protein OBBRIDRAFT_794292 [Obba rivulosa]